ncbi:phosphodiester glycosidase family protein [Nocardioides pacificus]
MSRVSARRTLSTALIAPFIALACTGSLLASPAMASPAMAGDSTYPRHSSDGVRGPIAEDLGWSGRVARRSNETAWTVAPGVSFQRWDQIDARGTQRVQLLTVDPSVPGVALDYASPAFVQSRAPLTSLLARDAAIAGINADFFDIGDTGAPLGVGHDRQRGVRHGPEAGWNSTFYLTRTGKARIGSVPMRAWIRRRPALRITNVNSPTVAPGGIGVFTRSWGPTSGRRVTDGQRKRVREVVVRHGRVRSTSRRLSRGERPRGIVLVGRDRGARELAKLRVGSRLAIRWRLKEASRARIAVAVSGNKVLLQDGQPLVVDDRELHPRTAIGIDEDTGRLLMVVVDGRQSFSRGATMVELALLLQQLGAESALNLDGGGSSTMAAAGPDGVVGVVNSPSDGQQRLVPNGLGVTYRPR